MKTFTIPLKHKKIPVVIGMPPGKFASMLDKYAPAAEVLIVTNPALRSAYGAKISSALAARKVKAHWALVPPGEKNKNFRSLEQIYSKFVAAGLDRNSLIIAFGGGIVGDMAGFAAATIYRGVRYVQMPTTLLAMVDSSVGGKTGVDLKEGKNLAGAFYQPEFIYISDEFLKTLPPAEIVNGLGEVVKYAVISDKTLFEYLESRALRRLNWPYVIERCVKNKAAVVAADERETKGVREILNFGHTYAHALEKASGYRAVPHGKAVALGVLQECRLAERITGFRETFRVKNLLASLGMPVSPPRGVSARAVAQAIYSDKKIRGETITMYLPTAIGRPRALKIPLENVRASLAAFY